MGTPLRRPGCWSRRLGNGGPRQSSRNTCRISSPRSSCFASSASSRPSRRRLAPSGSPCIAS